MLKVTGNNENRHILVIRLDLNTVVNYIKGKTKEFGARSSYVVVHPSAIYFHSSILITFPSFQHRSLLKTLIERSGSHIVDTLMAPPCPKSQFNPVGSQYSA